MDELTTRIRLGFVNAYLLEAKGGFILVDTGMKSDLPNLRAALDAAGCGKSALKLIVLSHADPDHVGNAASLSLEFACPAAIHEADAPVLEGGPSPRRSGRGTAAKALMAIQRLASASRLKAFEPLLGALRLEDGQDLSAYGLAARVLHLPGHTPGSIAIQLPDGDLLCGDLFANYKRPALSPFVHDENAYRASLQRIKTQAAGWKTVHPGHGKAFPASLIASMEF
jgi:hydroxyacylglutathione hydrolase